MSCSCLIMVVLNKLLETHLIDNGFRINFKILRSALLIYCKICDILRSCSRAFGSMIAPYFMTFISYTLLFSYSAFVYQKNPNERLFYFSLMTFSWSVLNAPPILYIYVSSCRIISESRKTVNLLQQITVNEVDLRILRMCNTMELLAAHKQPKLSCDLFEVNWKTFFGILGSLFSYTVILVQFYDVSKDWRSCLKTIKVEFLFNLNNSSDRINWSN